ncbi:MAG: membrane protein insertase YidC, partial [Candidatus Krumholzibacteria bacterium]|nr:membrane protein insertase YidC [Candidatus Krumholzibacteria bacterium]
EGRTGALSIGLSQDGRWSDLSGAVFSATVDGRDAVDGERIALGPDRPETEIVFSWRTDGGGFVEKRYRFSDGGYEVGLDVRIGRQGVLRETEAYSLAWRCGLPINEKDARHDENAFTSLGRVGEEVFMKSLGKFGKTDRVEEEGVVVWAGAMSKYFLSAVLTGTQRSGTLAMTGDRGQTGSVGWSVEYPFRGDPRLVEDSYRIYLGPLDMDNLKAYGAGLEKTIDLGRRTRFLGVIIFNAMIWMKRWIPNYGLVIIILSILTKVIFYRLTHKSFKSMKDMQRLQPKIKELQEKYKNDRSRLNQETMKAYKEAGVNPLGGCLPLVLQMPVFIALFNVLRNTIELRGAPFALWIDDLSQPDTLFGFGVKLPFIGSDFHLLPILMGAAMYVQSKTTGSPTGDAAGAAQTKMMTTMMPIVFTVLFYGMPSGLVLYWLVNNIFSIVQQWIVHRQVEAEDVTVATA